MKSDAASVDTSYDVLTNGLSGLADAALKFGPFLFSMLFLFVIVGKANRMYLEHQKLPNAETDRVSRFVYLTFLLGSMIFSFGLVLYSVAWWSSHQRDIFAYVFSIDLVPAAGNVEVCAVKQAFYKEYPSERGYKKYTIVVVRDQEIPENYLFRIQYSQKDETADGRISSSGCSLLVAYKGRSGDEFDLPSELESSVPLKAKD